MSLMAQVPVSTQAEKKIVVLEDLTGVNCGWCPDGAKVADEMKAARNGRMIIIANHEGGYATADWLTTDGTIIGNASGATGYPNGNVNRRVWSGSSTAHGRGSWASNGATIESEDSPVNIGLDAFFRPGSTKLEINVSLYYTADAGKSNFVSVVVLQDSIIAYQSGASSLYPARVDPATGLFIHMDVMRDYVTPVKQIFVAPGGFKIGDEVSKTNKGDQTDLSYTWEIPAKVGGLDINTEHLKVVVMVTEDEAWSEIYSGVEKHVYGARAVGINEAASLNDLQIYPNPFQNNATIEFNLENSTALQVSVYDMTGKVVQNIPSTVYPIGNTKIEVNGTSLESGLYYVNIVSEDGVITRKIVLNK